MRKVQVNYNKSEFSVINRIIIKTLTLKNVQFELT